MFVVRDGKAMFVPVKVGIAGERYFEVPSGLNEGDRVITGPFDRCAICSTATWCRSTDAAATGSAAR